MRVFPCGICLGVRIGDGLTWPQLINSNDEKNGITKGYVINCLSVLC